MLRALLSTRRASSALIGIRLRVPARSVAPNLNSGMAAHWFSVAFNLPQMHQPRSEAKFFSSRGVDDDSDEDEDEDDDEPSTSGKLEQLEFKKYDIEYLRNLEERGKLQLQPFYQRDFKWTQKQASVWLESILRGYPCLPEITLLKTIDEDGDQKYAVFDGQQRLTSIVLYIRNLRGEHWPVRKSDDSFRLEKLPLLKEFEGKTYKDLSPEQQNAISKYGVRCAVIPESWAMTDYIDFFKRIQGGGTPMTDHELRRALSQGPFTDQLDRLSTDEVVLKALDGCSGLKPDDAQQLLLRYFQYRIDDAKFGKPTLAQNGLETMKQLNRTMKTWTGDEFYKQDELVLPLKKSLELIIHVFHKDEAFRRPSPLIKDGSLVDNDSITKVWVDQSKLRNPIWDCTVAAFASKDVLKQEKNIRRHAGAVRSALISIMQTNPLFTDTLRSSDISARVRLFTIEILSTIEELDEPQAGSGIPTQQRKELIKAAIESNLPCSLCGHPLSPFE